MPPIPTTRTSSRAAGCQRVGRWTRLIGSGARTDSPREAAATSDGGAESCATGPSDAVATGGARSTSWPDHRPDEAVPVPRHRLDEPGLIGRVVQRLAQLPHGAVQTHLEIDERLRRPQHAPKLVAGHYLAWTHQERSEDLEGLFGQTDLEAVPPKFPRLSVELEYPEAKHVGVLHPGFHGSLQTERGAVYPGPFAKYQSDADLNACFAATWPVMSKTGASHCRGDEDRASCRH